ncbi:hypothetical protein Z052_14560 [Halorubrum sp. C191]|uniref:Uncharacterized protein n=2 Tax=Halorubrum TaxID=56688 RepID=A0A2G1WGM4_9EURY|nr:MULTISPECIES: hypothetical protein [Halorubrum]OYR54403.1 hypothetical protein DJ70_14045 [Halorubrum halodurans]PHQ38105.1 hypothetical protein DJ69_13390 [Halorubrum persicum]PHQ41474.1 hypothetical protein Z052_14560 [Halorubrum sp. C191]
MSAPDTTDDGGIDSTEAQDLNTGTTLTADGPGEFWCHACGARCTRNQSNGTEYGHLLDCPERDLPDPREADDWEGGPFSRSVGEGVVKSKKSSQLASCLEARDDD